MICKKCANIFDDSVAECPCCGWSSQDEAEEFVVKKTEPFVLNINFDDDIVPDVQTQQSSQSDEQTYAEESFENQQTSAPVTTVRRDMYADEIEEMPSFVEPEEKSGKGRFNRPVQRNRVERVKHPDASRPAVSVKRVSQAGTTGFSDKNTAIRKRATNIVMIAVCVLALVMAGLTAISAKTDAFTQQSSPAKTTPLTGLSGEDSGSLEKQLSAMSLSADFVFDCSKITPNEFLELIRPYDNGGLYSGFYSQGTKITDEADPADRFKVVQENQGYYSQTPATYAYYKISADEIDRILSAFGMPQAHTANDEDYYYSKGYYYFAHKDEATTGNDDIIDVTSSNRIDDGSYYVQCSRLNSQSGAALENSYLIVEKTSDEQMPWVIKKVSSEPVFDSEGKLDIGEDAVVYTMKTTSVQATADDGTVYCTYTVSYPEFGNGTLGEQIAGRIHTDIMSAINLSRESAQKDYEKYISYGGDKSARPFESETVCYVSYNQDGYIGVVRETADNLPDLDQMKKDKEEAESRSRYYGNSEEEKEDINLPARFYEAYLIEKSTGDFVKKDNVIGKDYQTAYELLYRIYSGYDYKEISDSLHTTLQQTSELISYGTSYTNTQTTQTYAEVPYDRDELGKKIYESASTLCEDGYVFCFVTEEGYSHRVVIPFSVEEMFVLDK